MGKIKAPNFKFRRRTQKWLFLLKWHWENSTVIKLIKKHLKTIRFNLIDHKKFQLKRIDHDIKKYSNPPVFNATIIDHFHPSGCKLCTSYNSEFTHKVMFESQCSMCFFACPGKEKWKPGCATHFPSFKNLLDLYRKIIPACIGEESIDDNIKQEFLSEWMHRKELFMKIKEILTGLPNERFTVAGFKFFPEIWELDNA